MWPVRFSRAFSPLFQGAGLQRPFLRPFSRAPCLSVPAEYLRDSYFLQEGWRKRLESPLLQKINPDDLFYELDQKYQADKVLSAVDVDIYINRADPDNTEEMEELAYRLRKSPATADTLPSTGHALIRAFLSAKKTDDLMRILNDRFNYGVFVDFYTANVLMNEFLKEGNTRDAAKVASLLMLEENFGPPTSKFLCLVSCLKYLENPNPAEWKPTSESESTEEEKARVRILRNVYWDQHFDLYESHHLVGKTLAKVGEVVKESSVLSDSAQLLGWALYGKWEKVAELVEQFASKKTPVYQDAIKRVTDLVDAAIAAIEASPSKTLPKPKLRPLPGMNVDDKDVEDFFKRIGYPEYEKIVPKVKAKLSQVQVAKEDGTMLQKSENLLSAALSESEDAEIQEQQKTYAEWETLRQKELDNQIRRFKAFKLTEDIEERKRELREKEEVIFFFDHEEEWMMKLPPEEQKGYKLPTEYIDSNAIPFVKVIPPKKIRSKKKKV